MAGYTTAFPNSLKQELAQAVHNFTQTSGDQFKLALGISVPTGTYDDTTTNYSQLVGNSDEVPMGNGYTTGGYAFTAAQNATPALGAFSGNTEAFWQWSVNPQWNPITALIGGCIIYNASKANRCVYVGSLGVNNIVSSLLTLVMPVNAAGTALLRLR
jgi:hypothetical protein